MTNIFQARARLSSRFERVLAGEEVLIDKAGKPVLKMVKHEPGETKRRPGARQGRIRMADDLDALPQDMASAFGVADDR